jgi:hypothetical protein
VHVLEEYLILDCWKGGADLLTILVHALEAWIQEETFGRRSFFSSFYSHTASFSSSLIQTISSQAHQQLSGMHGEIY